jgi:hypothetical protein
LIVVRVLKNQIEAQVVESALREEGVRFVIRTFEDTAYDGIFIAQKGYGQVLVEEEDRERAEKILAALP